MIRKRLLLVAVALPLALAGCGATTVVGSPSPSVGEAEATARAATAGGDGGPPVDACRLLPASDVQALIGTNDGGVGSPPVDDGGQCIWQNNDNYYTVTVDVGSTTSAPNGTLPALDPIEGPEKLIVDGMRDLGGGQVQYVVGTRVCLTQVATNDTADGGDTAAAVKLAGTVKSALG